MHTSVFATIFWTAFEATALKGLAWIAFLMTLILVESLAGRSASSRERSGAGSATPGRGGGRDGRCKGESLARMIMTLVLTPSTSDADELGRMGLLDPEVRASAPGEWSHIEADRWADRPA